MFEKFRQQFSYVKAICWLIEEGLNNGNLLIDVCNRLQVLRAIGRESLENSGSDSLMLKRA